MGCFFFAPQLVHNDNSGKDMINPPVGPKILCNPPVNPENTGKPSAPIVGIFYRSSSPNIDPFVQEGDTIKKGQVLCIVEAMKVMNEIKAPMDGVLVKIHVKNADLIEFDQPLMTIEG